MSTYDVVVEQAYEAAGIPAQDRDPTLAEQIQLRVSELTLQLAGPDSQGEGYLAKLGRLVAARQQAVELALADLLPNPQTAATNRDDTSRDETSGDETRPPAASAAVNEDRASLQESGPEGSGLEEGAEMPLVWPEDPAHPLNDEDLVEQLSPVEISGLLREFDQSQSQQTRLSGEESYRRQMF